MPGNLKGHLHDLDEKLEGVIRKLTLVLVLADSA